MIHFAKLGKYGVLLEAEVAPRGQAKFETRYKSATGVAISPGSPQYYQKQRNKWGAELRGYFNDPGMAVSLHAHGVHVEYPRRGYKAGEYRFRFNNTRLWWKLVEIYGLRLGAN